MRLKKYLLAFSLIMFLSVSASAQSGQWTGDLDVRGTKLQLIFNFDGEAVTLDVPDQGGKDIPATLTRTPEGKIIIGIPSIGARFEGLWLSRMIAGSFSQSGLNLPLSLRPGATKRNRPQTPAGPFPYTTEDVSFTNGAAVLSGTLTLPEGWSTKTPAVVMVTGSGLQNRDEELFEHKPFAVIADALARNGIASLRYDDRGFGKSTGDAASATMRDFKDDAEAGLDLLRSRFDRTGIIGHSEGGTIAMLLAGEDKVDFAVSLAGMFISGAETLLDQNRHALAQTGFSTADTEMYVNALAAAFEASSTGIPMPSPSDVPEALQRNFAAVLVQIRTPYLAEFISTDIAGSQKDITCPVLALNGTKDTQVDAAKNLQAIRPLLKSEKSVISEQPSLNHLFQHCQTGETSEYKTIEETFSPDVLDLIVEWINSL